MDCAAQVPSYVMLGIQRQSPPEPLPSVARASPLKDACSRMDLTAIHEILVKLHYKDDPGENEVRNMLYTIGSAVCFIEVLFPWMSNPNM